MANVTEPSELLAATTLAAYRDAFQADIETGRAQRFTIPYHFIPAYVIPMLYMSIPHVRRPWLYRARWLVLILVVSFNLDMMRSTSSTNVALAYATGLWACWSIMHNLAMLVWSRPQFEAERVARRRRSREMRKQETQIGEVTHSGSRAQDQGTAPGADTEQFEYYWQAFPADGTFLERLEWAFDLYSSFRGAGWNWAVPNVPSPQRPEKPLSGELVKMDTIPLTTRSGYATYPTVRDFVRTKVLTCAYAYVILDAIKVTMMRDPWWIVGPGRLDQVPSAPYLDGIPSWLQDVSRSLLVVVGMHAAIAGLFSLHDILHYCIASCVYPLRAELWRYSSVFGSFDLVLNRGLSGFWGACWHQTFRTAFTGPGTWLSRPGRLPRGSSAANAVTVFFAFLQSGMLHGSGSLTSIGPADPLYPMLFFLLSGAGLLLQRAACVVFRTPIDTLPRWARRAGNLACTVLWLHFTCWPLAADLAHAGIWLLEPVPVSLVRALGFGQVDHAVWRIDDDTNLHWRKGDHWWKSGFS